LPGPEVEQRLAAILAADVAGYTRLMADDEAATLAALDAARDVFREKIEAERGRIVDTAGDSVLAVFATATGAVRAAVAIQQALAESASDVPEARRMRFRIGVNLGEVMEKADGSVYGAGVNVAARLESLAEPGGVMVSDKVYAETSNRVDLDFTDAGRHKVKNVSESVQAFAVESGRVVAAEPSLAKAGARRSRIAIFAVIALLVVLAGSATWWIAERQVSPPPETVAVGAPLALPERPSIAVLPFNNLSDDPAQEYLADGLTEDLITDLSKIPALFVIARNSSFTYKNKPTKVQTVAEDLGVLYVLEGSVRRTGDGLRITAQLIDGMTGDHIWAERYDGAFADVFTFQDQVLAEIVANLAAELGQAEISAAMQAETESPQAYDAFLQGRDYLRRGSPDDTQRAIEHFSAAVALDPDFSRAYAGLAAAHWRVTSLVWEFAVGVAFQRSYESALEALAEAMRSPTAAAFVLSAEILALRGRHGEALAEIDQAIALAPNDAENHAGRARVLNFIGRAEDAEQSARLAMRLDPHYPPDYLRLLGLSLFHQQRYAEAAELIERVVSRQSEVYDDLRTLASAYGHLGQLEKARAVVEKYDEHMRIDMGGYLPGTVQEAGFWWYTDIFEFDRDSVERFQEGLRRAGVPSGTGEPERYGEFRALMSHAANGEYAVDGVIEIDAAMAKAMRDRGVMFVDVRDAGNFGRGHIPGAVHLELNIGLSEEALLELIDKDQEVVFSCWGKYCPYSAYAAAKAVIWGFTRVHRFAGGIPAWEDAGYPVEEGLGM
jgi:TolB-like protein/class 3 adenylate cyclase/rhodanese-related sulfurtransferase